LSERRRWPLAAKATVGTLGLALFVVAALAGRHDEQLSRTATAAASTMPAAMSAPSAVPTTTATTTTTAAPTTVRPSPPPTTRPKPRRKPTPPKPSVAPSASTTAQLAALPTGYLDTSHPYKRTLDFGTAWTDNNNDPGGHNGCDTRDDILHRDLTAIVTRPGTNDCVVVAGQLADRYTGTTIIFAKSHATAIQIDHVVPLHDTWELGAYAWPQSQRVDYANDPLVLLAVSGPENESKGDKLADEWRPPNTAEWCDYATRTVAIHVKYRLPVTATERQALQEMLTHC
jgi:hypothetical protein